MRNLLFLAVCALLCIVSNAIPIRDVQWGPCPVSDYYEKLNRKQSRVFDKVCLLLIIQNGFPQSSTFPFNSGFPKTTAEEWLHYANSLDENLDCGNFTVPIDWESDGSHMMDSIQFFVWRVRSPHGTTARNQLWILNGGPGGDGGSLVPMSDQFFAALGYDFDFIFPDHRGTGYSTYLGCPDQSDAAACEQYLSETWGDNLHYFTTTNAAYDIDHGIQYLAPNYKHNYLYGVSYGTYWANRYLVLNPTMLDAVVLDGICPPDLCRLYSYDINTDYAGKALMEYCGLDTTCIANLGLTPISSLQQLFDLLNSNDLPCAKKVQVTPEYLKLILTQALGDDNARALVGPVIKRLLRCNDDDVAALSYKLFPAVESNEMLQKSAVQDSDPGGSDILGNNIILSEMFIPVGLPLPSVDQLQAVYENAFFAYGTPVQQRVLYDSWDKYTPDRHYNLYPQYKGPVLMLNGNLDQATPLSWATKAANHFSAPKQQLVVIPYSPHGTVWYSAVDNSNVTCALQIMKSFLTTDNRNLDITCVNHMIYPDFSGTSERSQSASLTYFNTADMWGKDD